MNIIETLAYRKAFINYLRKGTPINLSKPSSEKRPTTHYVWRTVGDDKVRSSHAANDGKIFKWDNPPETGHPGEDHGCRCTAEPYKGTLSSESMIKVHNFLVDRIATVRPWGDLEMSAHFFIGNGKPITLDEIGHADIIRDYYNEHYLQNFKDQIIRNAIFEESGIFEDNFDATYDFEGLIYSYGESGIKGSFIGEITDNPDGSRTISGRMSFVFYDQFKDPTSFAEKFTELHNFNPFLEDIREEDLDQSIRDIGNLGSKPYPITGYWEMDYEEIIP